MARTRPSGTRCLCCHRLVRTTVGATGQCIGCAEQAVLLPAVRDFRHPVFVGATRAQTSLFEGSGPWQPFVDEIDALGIGEAARLDLEDALLREVSERPGCMHVRAPPAPPAVVNRTVRIDEHLVQVSTPYLAGAGPQQRRCSACNCVLLAGQCIQCSPPLAQHFAPEVRPLTAQQEAQIAHSRAQAQARREARQTHQAARVGQELDDDSASAFPAIGEAVETACSSEAAANGVAEALGGVQISPASADRTVEVRTDRSIDAYAADPVQKVVVEGIASSSAAQRVQEVFFEGIATSSTARRVQEVFVEGIATSSAADRVQEVFVDGVASSSAADRVLEASTDRSINASAGDRVQEALDGFATGRTEAFGSSAVSGLATGGCTEEPKMSDDTFAAHLRMVEAMDANKPLVHVKGLEEDARTRMEADGFSSQEFDTVVGEVRKLTSFQERPGRAVPLGAAEQSPRAPTDSAGAGRAAPLGAAEGSPTAPTDSAGSEPLARKGNRVLVPCRKYDGVNNNPCATPPLGQPARDAAKGSTWAVLRSRAFAGSALELFATVAALPCVEHCMAARFLDGGVVVVHKTYQQRLPAPGGFEVLALAEGRGRSAKECPQAVALCTALVAGGKTYCGNMRAEDAPPADDASRCPSFLETCEYVKTLTNKEWICLKGAAKEHKKNKNETPLHRGVNTYSREIEEFLQADEVASTCVEQRDDTRYFDYPRGFADFVPEMSVYFWDAIDNAVYRVTLQDYVTTRLHKQRSFFIIGLSRAGKTELCRAFARKFCRMYGQSFYIAIESVGLDLLGMLTRDKHTKGMGALVGSDLDFVTLQGTSPLGEQEVKSVLNPGANGTFKARYYPASVPADVPRLFSVNSGLAADGSVQWAKWFQQQADNRPWTGVAAAVEACAPTEDEEAAVAENGRRQFQDTNAFSEFQLPAEYGEDARAVLARMAWCYVTQPLFAATSVATAQLDLDEAVRLALAREQEQFPDLA